MSDRIYIELLRRATNYIDGRDYESDVEKQELEALRQELHAALASEGGEECNCESCSFARLGPPVRPSRRERCGGVISGSGNPYDEDPLVECPGCPDCQPESGEDWPEVWIERYASNGALTGNFYARGPQWKEGSASDLALDYRRYIPAPGENAELAAYRSVAAAARFLIDHNAGHPSRPSATRSAWDALGRALAAVPAPEGSEGR